MLHPLKKKIIQSCVACDMSEGAILVDVTSLNLKQRMWQQWANLVLGLWVIVVPFIGMTETALMWTLAITGIVIAGLSLWGGSYEQSEAHRRELQRSTA